VSITKIIAESGGTKSDWFIQGESEIVTRSSYHRANWNDPWFEQESSFWRSHDLSTVELTFYGAGCFNDEGKVLTERKLAEIGFENITVKSDLHAAGKAVYGSSTGWCAILGTGSVLFFWDGNDVQEIIGGKGHLEGDEGSGFYFGKLILDDYRSGKLDENLVNLLGPSLLNSMIATGRNDTKQSWASLAKLLEGNGSVYHRQNFEFFVQTHLREKGIKSIGVVGTYGAKNLQILNEVLTRFGVELTDVVERPMVRLIE